MWNKEKINAKGSTYLKIIKMICGNIILTVIHDLQLLFILQPYSFNICTSLINTN